MVERKCWCGKPFLAKEADVKRGWAKACSKSHAAISREKKIIKQPIRHNETNDNYDYELGLIMDRMKALYGW